MLAYLVLTGIVVFGIAFALWLGSFLLNRFFNTTLENAREGRRKVAGQLGYGIFLLGLTLIFGVVFFQMDREPVLPPMPPGVQPESARNLAQPETSSGSGVTLVMAGIGVSGFLFVLWFGTFMLARSINTSPLSSGGTRRGLTRQLGLGALLLGTTLVLGVVLSQMDRSALIPDVSLEPPAEKAVNPAQPKAAPSPKTTEVSVPDAPPKTAAPAPKSDTPSKNESKAGHAPATLIS